MQSIIIPNRKPDEKYSSSHYERHWRLITYISYERGKAFQNHWIPWSLGWLVASGLNGKLKGIEFSLWSLIEMLQKKTRPLLKRAIAYNGKYNVWWKGTEENEISQW